MEDCNEYDSVMRMKLEVEQVINRKKSINFTG